MACGGQSVVYSGRDLRFETRPLVAIKVYLEAASPLTMAQFRREASALAQIESSACVGVRDHGMLESGQPFLVMEWINGKTLQCRIKEGPLALAEVETILSKLGGALDEAHRKEIIHRDLKPSNIVLRNATNEPDPVLIDFGIARANLPGSATLVTGVISGTAAYMAPEQWEGNCSHASDQYSLALVAVEMLAGRRLPDAGWDPIPRQIRPVLERALAKNPAERHPGIPAFIQAFATAARPRPKTRLSLVASLLLALAAGSAALWFWPRAAGAETRVSYTIQDKNAGRQMRLSLSSTQPGYLYLVAEDPEGFSLLFPFLSAQQPSAALPANQPLLVPRSWEKWIESDDPSKPDTIWIMWSSEEPWQLRNLTAKAQAAFHGLVTERATVDEVRKYLQLHRSASRKVGSAVFSTGTSLAYPITIRAGKEIEGSMSIP